MKTLILACIISISTIQLYAQKKADTLAIQIGKASKIVFSIADKNDWEILKNMNMRVLFQQMSKKVNSGDSVRKNIQIIVTQKDSTKEKIIVTTNEVKEEWPTEADRTRYRKGSFQKSIQLCNKDSIKSCMNTKNDCKKRTYSSLGIDIGTNNYLENGSFPSNENKIYTVRPWGSWYIALNSIQRTHIARKLFLEWGGGVSWYNFKFQNNSATLIKNDIKLDILEDTRPYGFSKSKLTSSYVNIFIVPSIQFGNHHKRARFFAKHSNSFRIGAGGYLGYRIDSYTKLALDINGSKKTERLHDSFYLNSIRYGVRFQVGYSGVDFFVNYDLNNLFISNKGPQLNAISFGITL